MDTFHKIDILVNNAGIFIGGEVADLKEEIWDRVMAVYLKVRFLASEDSSYITGENLSVDGGSSASMFHLIHQLADQ